MNQHNNRNIPEFERLEQRCLLSATTYLSDMKWTAASNGWGPVERDRSVHTAAAGDGQRLRIGSASYDKGLGTHSNSDIRYSLNGQYDRFFSDIGIDEESANNGSVVFQVLGDGRQLFNSGRMTGAQAARQIDVSVAGVKELRLLVTDAGDGTSADHADWAAARLVQNAAAAPAAAVAQTTTYVAASVAAPTAGMIVVGPNEAIKSIGQAVNMAKPGQTVFIRNGTYRESITINKSGAAGKPILIQAQSVGGVVIDAGGRSFGISGANASFITLKGIKIVNANSGAQNNAALRTGRNWIVEDVSVERAAVAGIYVGGDNSTFVRVYARDCGQIGWWLKANNIMLKDSGATGNNTKKYNAAWEAGGAKFYMTNNAVVDGGTWANNGGPAIWFDYVNRNYVVKNTQVYGNHGWHQAWAGTGITAEINDGLGTFENNYVHDNSGGGIAIWEAFNVTIRNNRIVNDTIHFRSNPGRGTFTVRDIRVQGNTVTNGKIDSPNIGRNLFASRNIAMIGNTGI